MMRRSSRMRLVRGTLFYLMLAVILLVTILPFLWMLSSSFKGQEAIRTIPIRWIPERPTLEGGPNPAFLSGDYLRSYRYCGKLPLLG